MTRILRIVRLLLLRTYTRLYAWMGGIEIGPACLIHPGAVVRRHDGGKVRIGARCEIARGAMLLTYGGDITLGDDCSVQPYSVLYGHGGLKLGQGVRVATHVVIVPANHAHGDRTRPIHQQGVEARGIHVEDDVWVGAGARILDGVRVAQGCVIAAGAVVHRSTQAFGIYAGVPARKVRERGVAASEGGRP